MLLGTIGNIIKSRIGSRGGTPSCHCPTGATCTTRRTSRCWPCLSGRIGILRTRSSSSPASVKRSPKSCPTTPCSLWHRSCATCTTSTATGWRVRSSACASVPLRAPQAPPAAALCSPRRSSSTRRSTCTSSRTSSTATAPFSTSRCATTRQERPRSAWLDWSRMPARLSATCGSGSDCRLSTLNCSARSGGRRRRSCLWRRLTHSSSNLSTAVGVLSGAWRCTCPSPTAGRRVRSSNCTTTLGLSASGLDG
mmetsp:Transcript_27913/g.90214  ORF Transcript_27913/g.90214 Transcript_27913/m.90214 type:complete len:252 (+) Transcript_27913:163-918(+)